MARIVRQWRIFAPTASISATGTGYRFFNTSRSQASSWRSHFATQELHHSPLLRAMERMSQFRDTAMHRVQLAYQSAENATEVFVRERLMPMADEATVLRMEAFCKRNRTVILTVLGSGAVLLFWKTTGLVLGKDSSIQLGLLVLFASTLVSTGLVLRRRHSVNPDTVYNIVMHRLQNSAAFMEIMGNPVVGGKVRVYFTFGGDLKLSDLKPKVASNHCLIVFPVRGYEHNAVVSGEVIRHKGQYYLKLLAADIPIQGSEERFYIIGDEHDFQASRVPFLELRDPIVKAIGAEKELEALDEMEIKSLDKKKVLPNILSIVRTVQDKLATFAGLKKSPV